MSQKKLNINGKIFSFFCPIDRQAFRFFYKKKKRNKETRRYYAYWCCLCDFSICLRKDCNLNGCDIGGLYTFLSFSFCVSVSKFSENLWFLYNSFKLYISSSMVTNSCLSNVSITRHSVLGKKHFSLLFKYGW